MSWCMQKVLCPSQAPSAGEYGWRAGIINWHGTSTNSKGFGYFSGESRKSPQPAWSSNTCLRHVILLQAHTCQTTYCVSLGILLTTLLAAIWHLLLLWKQPASKHITQHCKQTYETHTSCQCLSYFSLGPAVTLQCLGFPLCFGPHSMDAGTCQWWSSPLPLRHPAEGPAQSQFMPRASQNHHGIMEWFGMEG